ncbi:hypothetical protein VF14_16905 [Nostoc linckia z18]|uniref:GIY-YIG domain-containing protein n=2 Tax=Nostoc linckia TaxID=92942 RepID=A0A9Q6ELS0_NOSLI|nr:hypothetical protein [Nostoc linckia]PHK32620.1 hypothetical protein VF12_26385 [Nostoc linckia z15]PHK45370.1 hypothetical protein VF13_16640 [Nostoc linckia z16]PHJ59239.1 hypothetical protein VF02_25485 [Nostoc linckia z1]PHJ69729.1 hypothetical protein VF03_23320 [Nostoc linckia z2]PHJ72310.1 hypothetical protein VF05_05115 [Nostoc linckia z3]
MKQKVYPSKIIATAKSINVTKLPWTLYIDKKSLPTYGGIYFVGTDQEPTAYIGQAGCLKTRFFKHHRKNSFDQLIDESGEQSVKIRYWQAPLMPKSELVLFLSQLESYLIENSKTRYNYTANSLPKTPFPSHHRTYYGFIFVQLNKLGEYYVPKSSDGTAGFYFSLKKIHMAEKAIKYRSPTFIISSGTWQDALYEYENNLDPKWKQYSTLYFLEVRFQARWINYVGQGGIEDYVLSGDQATFYRIFLNEYPGFKEFSMKYLTTGLTNCSKSDFCETLLNLTR